MLKKKSTYIIIALMLMLAGILLFVYLVHIPYVNYHHDLQLVKQQIIKEGNLDDLTHFSEYNSSETYYIVLTNQYGYVYDSSLERIYRKKIKDLYIEETKGLFNQEDYVKIEEFYGYENNKLCYVYQLNTKSEIVYRYYNLETGQLMKTYSLRK